MCVSTTGRIVAVFASGRVSCASVAKCLLWATIAEGMARRDVEAPVNACHRIAAAAVPPRRREAETIGVIVAEVKRGK